MATSREVASKCHLTHSRAGRRTWGQALPEPGRGNATWPNGAPAPFDGIIGQIAASSSQSRGTPHVRGRGVRGLRSGCRRVPDVSRFSRRAFASRRIGDAYREREALISRSRTARAVGTVARRKSRVP